MAHLFHRKLQSGQLLAVVLVLARGDAVERLARAPHPGLGDGDATGPGDAAQRLAPVGLLQPALGLGLGDAGRQLRRQGDHEGLFPFIEQPALFLLHHQNADHLALVHDGGTEEGAKRLFRDIGQKLETGVRRGIGQVDQLFPLAHQTDYALLERQGGFAHSRLGQPIGRRQSIAAHVGLGDINGAAVHRHGEPGLAHQCLQGLFEGVGLGHALDDASEFRQQLIVLLSASGCAAHPFD